jgi:ankyrin repeat protein
VNVVNQHCQEHSGASSAGSKQQFHAAEVYQDVLHCMGTASSSLLPAAASGDVVRIKAALAAGIDVNKKFAYGHSALMVAAMHGYTASISTLIEAGANVNACDALNWNALNFAARNANTGVIVQLLQAGIAVDGCPGGETPLIQALGANCVDGAEAMILAGADVNAHKATCALIEAARNGATSIVHLLLEAGASIDAEDDCNRTAWAVAVLENQHASARRLLLGGADPIAFTANDLRWFFSGNEFHFRGRVPMLCTLLASSGIGLLLRLMRL